MRCDQKQIQNWFANQRKKTKRDDYTELDQSLGECQIIEAEEPQQIELEFKKTTEFATNHFNSHQMIPPPITAQQYNNPYLQMNYTNYMISMLQHQAMMSYWAACGRQPM